MKKIVIASDSFKGSLSSKEIADAAEKGILRANPECKVEKICVADGGEGTVDAIIGHFKGELVTVRVSGPAGDYVNAKYGISDINGEMVAVMEMAEASGLTLLEKNKRNPLVTGTFGTGEMICDAISRGCEKIIMGLGGSATSDAGIGMLEALGFKFFGKDGLPLKSTYSHFTGKDLVNIYGIEYPDNADKLKSIKFEIAYDVDAFFYGPRGAVRMYAQQKGANEDAMKVLEEGMKQFSFILKKTFGKDISALPGSGAAGGLGGCIAAALGGNMTKGINLVLDMLSFKSRIADADLIITGEGCMDCQTLQGKTAYGILNMAKEYDIPVVAICGMLKESEKLKDFAGIFPIIDKPVSANTAMGKSYTAKNITRTCTQIIKICEIFSKKIP